MLRIFSAKAVKFKTLQSFAHIVQNGTRDEAAQALDALIASPLFATKGWQQSFAKLRAMMDGDAPQFSVFAMDGNGKLPFVAFSSLPAVTCPGAGDCLQFCYSFSAWRYPAAFSRQLQNAWLMRHNPDAIVSAWHALPLAEGFDFRLYVDGDFSSVQDIAFWFTLIGKTPSVRAYGYSKSFEELARYADNGGIMPTNYMLNISSGHRHDAAMVNRARALPITRGEFVAVNIGRKVKSSEHGTKAVNDAIRAASPVKVFPCPGKCGTCTGAGHACGLPQMKGRVIAIAVH